MVEWLVKFATIPLLTAGLLVAAVFADPNDDGEPISTQTDERSLVESVLIQPADTGSDRWRTLADLAVEAGYTPDDPTDDYVAPVALDPGVEDQTSGCGVIGSVAVPDGVKIAQAGQTIAQIDEDRGGGYLATAAAELPSEENAIARFDGYVAAMKECPDELLIGFDDEGAPFGLDPEIRLEELDLPDPAYGLRISVSVGDFTSYSQTDVIVRRGRMIAGLHFTGFTAGDDDVDVAKLAQLLIDRLERADRLLADSDAPIPVWTAEPKADRVAMLALIGDSDLPSAWDIAPAPVTTVDEFGGITTSFQGGRLFIFSNSPSCRAEQLIPSAGMVGRADTGLKRVGYDHYVWQRAAVFEDAQAALEKQQEVLAANETCSDEYRAERPPDLDETWESVAIDGYGEDVDVSAGVRRWRLSQGSFGTREVVSTDLSAVILNGRILSTLWVTIPYEDADAVEEALRVAVDRVREAQADLE